MIMFSIAQAVVGVENEEAKALDVDKHLKELMTMCKQVEMLMDELYELKLNGEVKKVSCESYLSIIVKLLYGPT